MQRRNFIKHISAAAVATILAPIFFRTEAKASPSIKLNYKPQPSEWKDNNLTISWIGHATVLINFFGKWILTDPALFERVGVYLFGASIGPSRLTPPALDISEFPKPDLILLSHAHMDHMDYPTLKHFANEYPNQIDVITAYLTKDVIEDLPWKSLNVMDWNDELILNGMRFKALEVQHFGWRFPWERDRSRGYMKDGRSFNAYVIDYKGKKVLFGGDTAMTDKLQVAKNENIDIAIMPIGAYNPWRRNHCNPEEALQMANGLNSKVFIPIHTKTFKQSNEPFNEAIDWMKKSAPNYSMQIGIDEIGQTYKLG